MTEKLESLADFVRRRMDELHIASTYEVARRSGGRVSNGTVWNILNGRVRDTKKATLLGLAHALKISPEEIMVVAHQRAGGGETDPEEERLLIMFREIPPSKRSDVLVIVRALHREHASRLKKGPRAA